MTKAPTFHLALGFKTSLFQPGPKPRPILSLWKRWHYILSYVTCLILERLQGTKPTASLQHTPSPLKLSSECFTISLLFYQAHFCICCRILLCPHNPTSVHYLNLVTVNMIWYMSTHWNFPTSVHVSTLLYLFQNMDYSKYMKRQMKVPVFWVKFNRDVSFLRRLYQVTRVTKSSVLWPNLNYAQGIQRPSSSHL